MKKGITTGMLLHIFIKPDDDEIGPKHVVVFFRKTKFVAY